MWIREVAFASDCWMGSYRLHRLVLFLILFDLNMEIIIIIIKKLYATLVESHINKTKGLHDPIFLGESGAIKHLSCIFTQLTSDMLRNPKTFLTIQKQQD